MIAIIGSTGVGKSKLAVDLAKRFKGEVISVDALQIYDSMPVSCNKITIAEQSKVPHHLMDYLKSAIQFRDCQFSKAVNDYTVTEFVRDAIVVVESVLKRRNTPILAGGTHYYMQSLLWFDDLLETSVRDHKLHKKKDPQCNESINHLDRTRLRQVLFSDDDTEIRKELLQVDPEMAMRWHPNDYRKIRRSLEIFVETGIKQSDLLLNQKTRYRERYPTLILWLRSDQKLLNERLEARIQGMFRQGLLKELMDMHTFISNQQPENAHNVDFTAGVLQSIGYKEFHQYLLKYYGYIAVDENGIDANLGESPQRSKLWNDSVERMIISTRQYAKKQVMWIKNKLIPVAAAVGTHVYTIDVGDVNSEQFDWDRDVLNSAVSLVDQFLSDKSQLPLEGNLSLDSEYAGHEQSQAVMKHCKACDRHIYTSAWEGHIKSRRHRKVLIGKTRLQLWEDSKIKLDKY